MSQWPLDLAVPSHQVEGLFAARVHPLTPGKALSDSCWWALLRGLRDCALQWYSALKGHERCFTSRVFRQFTLQSKIELHMLYFAAYNTALEVQYMEYLIQLLSYI